MSDKAGLKMACVNVSGRVFQRIGSYFSTTRRHLTRKRIATSRPHSGQQDRQRWGHQLRVSADGGAQPRLISCSGVSTKLVNNVTESTNMRQIKGLLIWAVAVQ